MRCGSRWTVRVPLDCWGPRSPTPGRLMLWKDMGCQPKNNGNFFISFLIFEVWVYIDDIGIYWMRVMIKLSLLVSHCSDPGTWWYI